MSTPVLDILSRIRDDALKVIGLDKSQNQQQGGTKYIAFMVNKTHYLVEPEVIKSVSVCENLKKIPQTKPWVRGITNTKGRLYSVSDLSIFSGSEQYINFRNGHLLLLNDDELQSALLVTRVLGFRYFNADYKKVVSDSQADDLEAIASFISEIYRDENIDWFKLNTEQLIASEQFREVQ